MNALIRHTMMICLAILFALGSAGLHSAQAKTVSDPNHKGWVGKHPNSKTVEWKPIKAKCDKCSQMVEQYNSAMQQLLNSRYWVNFWRSVNANREKGKADPFWPGKGDITNFEGKAIGANLELMESQGAQLELHKSLVRTLEQQTSYLRGAIIQCEMTACGTAKKPKIKDIKIGGQSVKQPWQPDIDSILKQHKVDWKGPYSSNCLPCKPIITQLNAVPGWIVRAHMKLQIAESQLKYSRMRDQANKIKLDFLKYTHPDKSDFKNLEAKVAKLRAEITALNQLFRSLLGKLSACEKKYCTARAEQNVSLNDIKTLIGTPDICNAPAANDIITVGPNNKVGSKANFKEKTKKKITGAAVGALAKLAGVGGGGTGGDSGPTTYKDPVKNKYKTKVKSKKPKRELRTGGVFTPDGLLISSDIKKAPGKGTFQTIYLQNANGWRLTPIALFMYEIWRDWKLSVSWTRDTYIDGELVKHEEGGWTESWRELIARGEETIFGLVPTKPLWEQLGFTTAVSGAKSLGTLFPVSPAMLQQQPWNLVIHVTDPKKDPVITVPYIFELSLNSKGIVVAEPVETTVADRQSNCSISNPNNGEPVDNQNASMDMIDDQAITDLMASNIASFLYQAPLSRLQSVFQSPDNSTLINLENEAFDWMYADWEQQLSGHYSPELIGSTIKDAIDRDDFFQLARDYLQHGIASAEQLELAQLYSDYATNEIKSAFDQALLSRDLADAYTDFVDLDGLWNRLEQLINRRDNIVNTELRVEMNEEIERLELEILDHEIFIDLILEQGQSGLDSLSSYNRSLLPSHIININNEFTDGILKDPLDFHSVLNETYGTSPHTPAPTSDTKPVTEDNDPKDDPEIKKFLEELEARRRMRAQEVNEVLVELKEAGEELQSNLESAAEELLKKPEDVYGYCGPDVTKPFMESLARIHQRMKSVPNNEKGIIDGNQFMMRNGGNIDYWSKYGDWKGTTTCPTLRCASSDPCFTFKGRCFPLHVFSDTMFGFVADQLYLPEFDAKAGGAAHEGSKSEKKRKKGHTMKQGYVKGAMSAAVSLYEDFIPGYKGQWQLKEPEATTAAYKFGDELSEDFDDGKIKTAADISSEQFNDLVKGVYAKTPGSWPNFEHCVACPDPVPLSSYNNYSIKDWLLSDDKTQYFNVDKQGKEVYEVKASGNERDLPK